MKQLATQLLVAAALLTAMATAAELPLPAGVMPIDGRPAPELRLADIDGKPFDLAASRGHWVFVHFWASWCGPCRREMPTLPRMMSQLGNAAIEMVLVNTAETEDTVFTFLAIVAPDLTPLLDLDGLVTERWQPRGLPATFLVDPEGKIQYLALGGRPWDTPPYVEFLRKLVRQAPPQE